MIRVLSKAKEFENIKLRRFEKEMLNTLNKNKLRGADVIRFSIEEGINTRESKINWYNCILIYINAVVYNFKIVTTSRAYADLFYLDIITFVISCFKR